MKTQEKNFVLDLPDKGSELDAFAQELQDISAAAASVRDRLGRYAETTNNDSLRRQAETLRTWLDINGEGLAVAARAAELGQRWASEVRIRLEAASQDLGRLDGDTERVRKNGAANAELIQIWNEVNSVLDSMEALYRSPAPLAVVVEQAAEPASAFVRSPPYPK